MFSGVQTIGYLIYFRHNTHRLADFENEILGITVCAHKEKEDKKL